MFWGLINASKNGVEDFIKYVKKQSIMKYEEDLIQIVREQNWLMELLKATRELDLPDCYIAAGAIRNTVWNHLHGFPTQTNQHDVDVAYFDSSDILGENAESYQQALISRVPNVCWEVVNQAGAHLMGCNTEFARRAAKSSGEAMAYWSETPTGVGVRLERDDSFTVAAPHGLDDLMNLVVRPVPKPYQSRQLYERRVREKRWQIIWPRLIILHEG